MDQQVPGADQSSPPPLGPPPTVESLHRLIAEQRARVQKLLLVHNEAEAAWRREDKILEEFEDKLYSIQQGQMSL